MDSTTRFTDRATAYQLFRPRYPTEFSKILQTHCNLRADSVVADVGSGTGILTELFLQNGNTVHAVEPNAPMRAVAERNLGGDPRFHSIPGTAETTLLPDSSIDLIAAGQAFHWFDRDRARAEFTRILRPDGWIVLVWNERLTDSSPFAAAYEGVLHAHSIDYTAMNPRKVSGDQTAIRGFLGPRCQVETRQHGTRVSLEELVGLLASASYAPLAGHAKYAGMIAALKKAFDAHQENGTVPLDYEMKVYYARRLR